MSNKGKIYCAHCIFTGKKYIGQTITLLEYRVSQHFTLSKNYNHKFANALKKYGKDGFIWGIIEECEEDELDKKEIFWIKVFNTYNRGYNSTTGGNQGREYCTKQYLIETPNGEKELIENLTKYCRDNHLRRSSMQQTLQGKCLNHNGYKLIPQTQFEIERHNKVRELVEKNKNIRTEKTIKFVKENHSKKYLVEKPNGERELIKNLSQYCRDNELRISNMLNTLCGKVLVHKNYKLIPRTEEEIEKYNQERMKREDTSRKGLPGEKNGRAILNWDKVNQIRELHKSKKYKNKEIADMFGIKKVTIEKIVANKLWTV